MPPLRLTDTYALYQWYLTANRGPATPCSQLHLPDLLMALLAVLWVPMHTMHVRFDAPHAGNWLGQPHAGRDTAAGIVGHCADDVMVAGRTGPWPCQGFQVRCKVVANLLQQ